MEPEGAKILLALVFALLLVNVFIGVVFAACQTSSDCPPFVTPYWKCSGTGSSAVNKFYNDVLNYACSGGTCIISGTVQTIQVGSVNCECGCASSTDCRTCGSCESCQSGACKVTCGVNGVGTKDSCGCAKTAASCAKCEDKMEKTGTTKPYCYGDPSGNKFCSSYQQYQCQIYDCSGTSCVKGKIDSSGAACGVSGYEKDPKGLAAGFWRCDSTIDLAFPSDKACGCIDNGASSSGCATTSGLIKAGDCKKCTNAASHTCANKCTGADTNCGCETCLDCHSVGTSFSLSNTMRGNGWYDIGNTRMCTTDSTGSTSCTGSSCKYACSAFVMQEYRDYKCTNNALTSVTCNNYDKPQTMGKNPQYKCTSGTTTCANGCDPATAMCKMGQGCTKDTTFAKVCGAAAGCSEGSAMVKYKGCIDPITGSVKDDYRCESDSTCPKPPAGRACSGKCCPKIALNSFDLGLGTAAGCQDTEGCTSNQVCCLVDAGQVCTACSGGCYCYASGGRIGAGETCGQAANPSLCPLNHGSTCRCVVPGTSGYDKPTGDNKGCASGTICACPSGGSNTCKFGDCSYPKYCDQNGVWQNLGTNYCSYCGVKDKANCGGDSHPCTSVCSGRNSKCWSSTSYPGYGYPGNVAANQACQLSNGQPYCLCESSSGSSNTCTTGEGQCSFDANGNHYKCVGGKDIIMTNTAAWCSCIGADSDGWIRGMAALYLPECDTTKSGSSNTCTGNCRVFPCGVQVSGEVTASGTCSDNLYCCSSSGSSNTCVSQGGTCTSFVQCANLGGTYDPINANYDCGSNVCCKGLSSSSAACANVGGSCATLASCVNAGGTNIGNYGCGDGVCCKSSSGSSNNPGTNPGTGMPGTACNPSTQKCDCVNHLACYPWGVWSQPYADYYVSSNSGCFTCCRAGTCGGNSGTNPGTNPGNPGAGTCDINVKWGPNGACYYNPGTGIHYYCSGGQMAAVSLADYCASFCGQNYPESCSGNTNPGGNPGNTNCGPCPEGTPAGACKVGSDGNLLGYRCGCDLYGGPLLIDDPNCYAGSPGAGNTANYEVPKGQICRSQLCPGNYAWIADGNDNAVTFYCQDSQRNIVSSGFPLVCSPGKTIGGPRIKALVQSNPDCLVLSCLYTASYASNIGATTLYAASDSLMFSVDECRNGILIASNLKGMPIKEGVKVISTVNGSEGTLGTLDTGKIKILDVCFDPLNITKIELVISEKEDFICPTNCRVNETCGCAVYNCKGGLIIVRSSEGMPVNYIDTRPIYSVESDYFELTFIPKAIGKAKVTGLCFGGEKIKTEKEISVTAD